MSSLAMKKSEQKTMQGVIFDILIMQNWISAKTCVLVKTNPVFNAVSEQAYFYYLFGLGIRVGYCSHSNP